MQLEIKIKKLENYLKNYKMKKNHLKYVDKNSLKVSNDNTDVAVKLLNYFIVDFEIQIDEYKFRLSITCAVISTNSQKCAQVRLRT